MPNGRHKHGANYGQAAQRLPSDDEVWARRETCNWTEWAAEIGMYPRTMSQYMSRRGWHRSPTKRGTLTHAPCAVCGTSTLVSALSASRLCSACMAARSRVVPPEVVMCRFERRRRQKGGDRYPLMHFVAPCYIHRWKYEALRVHAGYHLVRHRAAV